jgi:hypothetical protein
MSDFGFLENLPAAGENELAGGVLTPVTFNLPDGSNMQEVAESLKALNPLCRCEIGESTTLTVFVPPNIKIGSNPFDLRSLAFVLKGMANKDELELGTLEGCCGHEGKSCCVNL